MVSVLMSCYNHDKFVGEAIESVLGQTFQDFEFIILDNGSTDGSTQIIADYEKKDDRIRVIFHKNNLGIPRALNELLDSAKGNFLARIDSDDMWVSNKLEKQLEVMKKDENLIVWTEADLIDAESISTGKRFTERYENLKRDGDIFDQLLAGNYIFCSSMMYKRENLEGIRYNPDIRNLNDHKFNLDLSYRYKYYFIPETLSKYRLHGGNTIFSDMEGWYKDYMAIGKFIAQEYGDRLNSNENKKKLFHLIFTTPFYSAVKQDPWNILNLIYGVKLPPYAIYILVKTYFHQINGQNRIYDKNISK
jgi:glycosyltransferase involved in cell wall biosynthesis